MIEALKPCPFCGSDQVFVWKRPEAIPRYFVICPGPGCERDINGESTQQQAIAAWNRRASPSWSTEPPTEEGLYLLRRYNKFGEAEPVVVRRSSKAFHLFAMQANWALKSFCKDYPKALWLKIDDPAPPEESEVPHD